MEYSQVLDSYESFAATMKSDEDLRIKTVSFADYGKAVFGCYIFRPEAGLGAIDPTTDEYKAALAAAMPAAPLIVWMKFGQELKETATVLSSLSEMNAVVASDPSIIPYRAGGIPAAVDYRDAGSGVSRTYTIDQAGYKRTDRRLTAQAMFQYRDLDWQFIIGEMDMGAIPRPVMPSMARPRT